MKKIKNKYNLPLKISFLMLVTSMFFVHSKDIFAENSISQIDQNSVDEETRKKLDDLKRKAEVYRQIIELKEKQSDSLNDQLSITNDNIKSVQSQIDSTTDQIEDYNSQIIRLGSQIKDKENVINFEKKLLSSLMQEYHETQQGNILFAYLKDGNFSSLLTNKGLLMQTSDRISEMADSIKKLKNGLEYQRSDLDNKKTDVVTMNQKLQNQNDSLQNEKDKRQALLSQTKDEEVKYRQLLANVEQQKKQLLDIDQFFAASGLSVDSYPKPDAKYFASTSWFFSQRDPRWGNENIGKTKTLMKSYGCAVTAVAMVFKENGGSMDPGDLANQPIFSGDLINWPGSWSSPKISLASYGSSHGNMNWSVIDAQIAKGNPVIVYIGKSKGGGGHYVVVHHKTSDGQYVVHDPYFGPNIFLNTSRALVGAMGTNSSTFMNQMIIYN